MRKWLIVVAGSMAVAFMTSQCRAGAAGQTQGTAQNTAAKQIGTIKAISGNSMTLVTDSGSSISVEVQDAARIVRVAPGQKDLKGATPIHLQDLQVGDRILVGGKGSDDGKSIAAAVVVAMKASDVEAKQEKERQDWQRRGIGGLVSAVDPASATITISSMVAGQKKSIAVHTTSTTVFRRYAPDSVKFDDAKPSSIIQIQPGDQLRARGSRSEDNTEFAADEVVSGAFRNIAGTIASVDPATNTVVVKDVASKKTVTVKISADSQVRKLPDQMARFLAMRLKGGPGQGGGNPGGQSSGGQRPASMNSSEGRPGGMGGNRPGGGLDFQQVLNRLPAIGVSDLHKDDAVMIVSSEGSSGGAVTAITLLAGVEPILEASPGATLPPWGLGTPAGGGDESGGGPQQ